MIKDGQFYIDFPEPYKRRELNAKYREIPLKDTTSRQLRKYFNAMANLYGIIPLRKAYEIISSQSPKLVTRDEFLAFAEIISWALMNSMWMGNSKMSWTERS